MKRMFFGVLFTALGMMFTGCGDTSPSNTRAVTAFRFTSPAAEGTISETSHTIAVTVPSGTNVSALVPTITHTGASIDPATGVARDFTNPVVYTVTAADTSTQDYTVTVTVTPWTACGDVLTYAGDNYPTVQIGTQCWLARNLNVGAVSPSSVRQGTSCSSVQKFCYEDSGSNCVTYGGFIPGRKRCVELKPKSPKAFAPRVGTYRAIPNMSRWRILLVQAAAMRIREAITPARSVVHRRATD